MPSKLNAFIDVVQSLPLPQAILALPCDWATWLAGDGRYMFLVPKKLDNGNHQQWSGLQIEMLLRKKGIRVWGKMFTPTGDIMFTVKKSQFEWAAYLLSKAGVVYR